VQGDPDGKELSQTLALQHLFQRNVAVIASQADLAFASGNALTHGVAVEVDYTHHNNVVLLWMIFWFGFL
jgi:hypothetical protein